MMPAPGNPVASIISSSTNKPTSCPSSKSSQQSKIVVNKPVTSAKSPQPTPLASSPSKGPTTNTNCCGISWEDHIKDCRKHCLPCPHGDECPSGEECFKGSLCAILISPGDANVKSTTSSDGNGRSDQQYTSTTDQTVPQNESTSSELCSLCGDSEVSLQ